VVVRKFHGKNAKLLECQRETFSSTFSNPKCRHFMKLLKQCFLVVLFLMLCNVVLSFELVDQILKCDHSNESY